MQLRLLYARHVVLPQPKDEVGERQAQGIAGFAQVYLRTNLYIRSTSFRMISESSVKSANFIIEIRFYLY